MTTLPRDVAHYLPIFKVWADDGKHPSVALDRPVCVIGRREVGVNLPLAAPQVSKLHALVVRTQRQVYVRDLASRNGVQRNGAPVQEVGLSDEDVLRVGSYTLRCASGFGHGEEPGIDDTGAGAVESPLPPAKLIGPDGVTYPFPAGRHTVLIGQREGCDVRLDGDDDVAPVHAILFEMDGKRYIRDLGAPSGTFLNQQSIHQAELNAGDEIRVGDTALRYAPADATTEAGDDAAQVRDALAVDDSVIGIDLMDSVAAKPNVATGDSVILPEITMEDSRAPAPASRAASPISEYDMDVIDTDPRRESTFAGEVVVGGDGKNALKADEMKHQRPEVPPATPASVQRGLEDSSIPIAGSFHDNILDDDDDLLHKLSESAPRPQPDAPAPAPPPPAAPAPPAAAEAPKPEAQMPGAPQSDAPKPDAPEQNAPTEVTAGTQSVEEVISQLVEEVNERVEEVSEKVEVVAGRVDRVAHKMTEVTKDVSEVAQTAGALQDVWSQFREGEQRDHPGTSERTAGQNGDGGGEKADPQRNAIRKRPKIQTETQPET